MDEAAAKTEWQIHAVCLMPNHVHIEKRMEVRRAADLDGEWHGIRPGWCLGDEEFREELMAAVHDRRSASNTPEIYGWRVRNRKQGAS